MRAGQTTIVLIAFLALLASAGAHPQQKIRTDPVVLRVTVVNEKGRAIGGLQHSNFSIVENRVPQTNFALSSHDEPASVGILFDASGSMSRGSRSASLQKLQILRDALGRFIELSHPSNEYFVIGFSSNPRMLLDWTSDHRAIIEKLGSLGAIGDTALYDACYLGIQKVMDGRYPKRAILLISDGQDNRSQRKLSEVRESLKESSVLLYPVGVIDISERGETVVGIGMPLDELGANSGGWAFFPRLGPKFNAAEINDVFEVIADYLRKQYTITVEPARSTGRKQWHKIKVKVSSPAGPDREMKKLYVKAPEGYYQY
jgi:Ca-activated chloride channel family protein